ncbi:hypothetical protein P4O66_009873, partial [Electrophorus voltai]
MIIADWLERENVPMPYSLRLSPGGWGKRAALVEVKRLLAAEQKTENKLTAAKIRNLALQMRVQSREEAIGELEERTKAEKLKFENENYKTMILEYEEEVIRIKKGITSTRE